MAHEYTTFSIIQSVILFIYFITGRVVKKLELGQKQ